jgi:hypothetical protein
MRDYRLESRMRENRLSGSEGGGDGEYPFLPTPIVILISSWAPAFAGATNSIIIQQINMIVRKRDSEFRIAD